MVVWMGRIGYIWDGLAGWNDGWWGLIDGMCEWLNGLMDGRIGRMDEWME